MAKGRKTGGRTKGTPNRSTGVLKAYAQQFDEEAIDFLVSVMRGTVPVVAARGKKKADKHGIAFVQADYRERVAAARELLDRGHGKPAQALTGADGAPLEIPAAINFILTKAPGADTRP